MKRLPNLSTSRPIYTIVIPTTNETVSFSPYSTEQEKAILIASQEDGYSSLISTLQNLLSECCTTEIKTVVDFTTLITNIKAKSHGGQHSFIIKECECGYKGLKDKGIEVSVNDITEQLKIKNPDKLKDTYKITDKISLRLCPTKIDFLTNIKFDDTPENAKFQIYSMIANSVDFVVNDKDIIKDFTTEDLIENIIKHLTPIQIQEINEIIGNLISIYFEVKYKCVGCGEEKIKEISDFLL